MKLIDFCQGVWPRNYAVNWHLTLIARQLEKTLLEGGNLMLFCPPRHGKSEMCCVYGPAFGLGLDPLLHFMTITNSDELASKSSFGLQKPDHIGGVSIPLPARPRRGAGIIVDVASSRAGRQPVVPGQWNQRADYRTRL